jgi:hypothetical protein
MSVRNDDGSERIIPRIGPLIHTLPPQPDPDLMLTRKIEKTLKAIEQGGNEVEKLSDMASRAKKDFASHATNFGGLQSLSFVASFNVADRGIERHEGKVTRVNYYKLLTNKAPRYILIYLTADDLVTDEDVVDD